MGVFGYAAMFEQFTPTDLLKWSQEAEDAGFGAVMASDHFHPWTPQQGQAAFVWAWMGALGAQTRLRLGPGVTAHGYRYHPAILAQASATLAAMFPGRCYLGVGAGEALNEHVVGDYWPEASVRLDRLAEAIDIIQRLFTGRVVKHQGAHFRLESARLYTLPDVPPPIYVATSGPVNAERTGRTCDGIITVGAPDDRIRTLLQRFEKGASEACEEHTKLGGLIQAHVSFAGSRDEASDPAVLALADRPVMIPK